MGKKPLQPLRLWLKDRPAEQSAHVALEAWKALPLDVKQQYSIDTKDKRGVKGATGSAE